jgi:ornithine decarboxylase
MPAPPPPTRSAAPILTWKLARQLAAAHGTPLQVVSRRRLTRNYRAFATRLPGATVCYAAKANRAPEVLSHLQRLGGSLDVCTPAEVRAGLAAGFGPDRMLHTHPCKTPGNLAESFAAGVRWFVYDAEPELDKLARLAPDAQLLLRLAERSGADIDLSKKFGCDPAAAPALLAAARRRGLAVKGLSFHLGSQCLDPEDFGPVLKNVRAVYDAARAAGHALEVVDIGGGPPAPYKDPPAIMPLGAYLGVVQGHLTRHFGGTGVRVLAEPGRAVVADAVTAVVRVLAKTRKGSKTWYVLDDGLYGTWSGLFGAPPPYPILAENAATRRHARCVLAGPTCDSLDVVGDGVEMPADLAVGELLLVPSVGAYSLACATSFNGIDPPRVVAIDFDPDLDD